MSPGPAPVPGDGSPQDLTINLGGFIFDHYGVRVPAIIVSPLIPQGTVDHTVYDHTSVLATLERLYGMPPLTKRDAQANDLQHLLTETTPRTDCPVTLVAPAPAPSLAPAARLAPSASDDVAASDEPLPQTGNVHGLLATLLKTDLDLARGDAAEIAAIQTAFAGVSTQADAVTYAEGVIAKARAAEANRAMPPVPRAAVTGGSVEATV